MSRLAMRLRLPTRTGQKSEVYNPKMIEMHTHILPGLDDGAIDTEVCYQLIQSYTDQGVSDLICTPHFPTSLLNAREAALNFFQLLEQTLEQTRIQIAAAHLPITLHAGLELVLTSDLLAGLETLQQNFHKPMSLAGSAYILVELPRWLNSGLRSVEPLLFNLQLAGYFPILAHPERIVPFADALPILESWVEQERIYLQINTSSLVEPLKGTPEQKERYNRRRPIVDELIHRRMVHFIASDAHNTLQRPVQNAPAWQVISQAYNPDLANLLLQENEARLLADESILRPT